MAVTVYVLGSLRTGKRYVGITGNLKRRLREHASGASRGGQLLGRFELVHTEECADHQAARARGKFLKSGQGRVWLDRLVSASRPTGVCATLPVKAH